MAKVAIKSEKLSPFGGIFSIMEQFDSNLSSVIDSTLGMRCRLYGYQYSEIIRSLMSVYFCGGSCIEDVTTHLMYHLSLHPTLRTCSADTILRAIKELTQDNISYTSDTGKTYDFNTADKLNTLLLNCLLSTGLLKEGEGYDVDFDHQFIEAEKYDAKPTYKKFLGYRPGVAVIGDLIVGIENSDGNTNVRFRQKDTLKRFFERFEQNKLIINRFILLTALIRNFYKFIMARLDVKRFGLKATSRIKAFVFKFISVPAKWVRTSRQYVLNIYSCNNAYADVFQNDFG